MRLLLILLSTLLPISTALKCYEGYVLIKNNLTMMNEKEEKDCGTCRIGTAATTVDGSQIEVIDRTCYAENVDCNTRDTFKWKLKSGEFINIPLAYTCCKGDLCNESVEIAAETAVAGINEGDELRIKRSYPGWKTTRRTLTTKRGTTRGTTRSGTTRIGTTRRGTTRRYPREVPMKRIFPGVSSFWTFTTKRGGPTTKRPIGTTKKGTTRRGTTRRGTTRRYPREVPKERINPGVAFGKFTTKRGAFTTKRGTSRGTTRRVTTRRGTTRRYPREVKPNSPKTNSTEDSTGNNTTTPATTTKTTNPASTLAVFLSIAAVVSVIASSF